MVKTFQVKIFYNPSAHFFEPIAFLVIFRWLRHINHPLIDNPYKCHKNTNLSRVPQLSKAPIHTSKLKYVPNLLQA